MVQVDNVPTIWCLIHCLQMLVTSICYNFGQQEPTLQLLTNLAWGRGEGDGGKPDKIITPHWPLPSWNVLGPWKYPQTAVSKQFVLTKDLWINTKFATYIFEHGVDTAPPPWSMLKNCTFGTGWLPFEMINISIKHNNVQTRVWRIYSNIQILEYIYWSQIFIRTFVLYIFLLTNIFGHSFVSTLFVRIYSC